MTAATVEKAARSKKGEDSDARRALAFSANYELGCLVGAAKKLLEAESDEETMKYTGILSRIELLSDIIFHAARLDGTDGSGWGEWDDLHRLQRAFSGKLA